MKRKKNLYFNLEVTYIVKCDLLEVNNVNCLKNTDLNFNVEFTRLKLTLSFLEVLTETWKTF